MRRPFSVILFASVILSVTLSFNGFAATTPTLAQQEAAREAAAKAAAAKAAAAKAATTTKTAATNAAITTVTAAKPTVVTTSPSTTTPIDNPLKSTTSIVNKSTPSLAAPDKSTNQTGNLSGPSENGNYITGSPTSSQQ
jgi:membrane protein involved in colicin uptake